jgi:hypothetical protein
MNKSLNKTLNNLLFISFSFFTKTTIHKLHKTFALFFTMLIQHVIIYYIIIITHHHCYVIDNVHISNY